MDATVAHDQFLEPLRILEEAAIKEFGLNTIVPADHVPNNQPADQFPKFMQLPAELRLSVWDQAFQDEGFRFCAPFPRGSIQRFRFDLRWDPDRVKPGKDESRGWVACFTPLSINTRPYLKFLRVCYESREYMMHKWDMSMLTVHELRHDEEGIPVGSPRKCHMPYNFGRDVFCVEGISHGLRRAGEIPAENLKRIKDRSRVCPTPSLHLADILEVALGLRFAPRIKRLAIIPGYADTTDITLPRYHQIQSFSRRLCGKNTATLAKRFPALVSIRSGIPQAGYSKREKPGLRSSPGYFQWYGADLRGHGQGGPTRMSEEDRDERYRRAWVRLFDRPFNACMRRIKAELWKGCGFCKGCVCLVRRSKSQLSIVDESGPPFPQLLKDIDIIDD